MSSNDRSFGDWTQAIHAAPPQRDRQHDMVPWL